MRAATEVSAWPAPSARFEPGHGRLVVTIDIPAGCHIQSHTPREPFLIPTTVELEDVDGVRFGAPVFPAGEVERFDWTPVELEVYRGTVDIVVPVSTLAGSLPSGAMIHGRVRYQGCTETACLPPAEHRIETRLGGTA